MEIYSNGAVRTDCCALTGLDLCRVAQPGSALR